MVVVAVAGGLGDLGQQISKSIQDSRKHEVIILKRKGGTSQVLPGFRISEVDYSSVEKMTEFLNDNNIHTIVSALAVHWHGAGEVQMALIQAAEKSQTVKRFIPSEFHIDYELSDEILPMPGKEIFLQSRQALAKTDLDYTLIYTSFFMDYFGLPNCPTPMRGLYFMLDVLNRKAVVPGDGTAKVVFTLTSDIGKFIVPLMDETKWDKVYNLAGDVVTLGEVVKIAEKVTGTAFNTTYDSLDILRKGISTVLEPNEEMIKAWPGDREETLMVGIACSIGMIQGAFNVTEKGTSLTELFPHIPTVKVEEYLRICFE